MKKLLSILLIFMLLISLAPASLAAGSSEGPIAGETASEPVQDGRTWITGDADEDGKLTPADAALILSGASVPWSIGSVNRDTTVDRLDAALILQALVGKGDSSAGWTSYDVLRIVTQPVDGEIPLDGMGYKVSIEATGGKEPYTYEWYLNGSPDPNSQNKPLRYLYTVGEYYIKVSDGFGQTVTSKSFTVTKEVLEPLVITKQPTSGMIPADGRGYRSSIEVTGGKEPYTYRWYLNGSLNQTREGDNYQYFYTAGEYYIEVTDAMGQKVTSDTYIVTPTLKITKQPTGGEIPSSGFKSSIEVTGGKEPYTYRWYLNGSLKQTREGVNYQYFYTPGEYYIEVTDAVGNTVTSSKFTLFKEGTNPLRITKQPTGGTIPQTGLGLYVSIDVEGGNVPYTYRWYLDGALKYTQKNQNYYHLKTAGEWYVEVTDSLDKKVTSDKFTVASDLRITRQPKGGWLPSDGSGLNVTIEVENGKPPYTYDWYLNGSLRFSGTQTTDTTRSNTLKNVGEWYVVVSDSQGGKVTSDKFTVKAESLRIVVQPESVMVDEAYETVKLSCYTSGGVGTISYQWQRWNETAQMWQNFKTGRIIQVDGTQLGRYRCIVSDSMTSITSDIAEVALNVLRIENVAVSPHNSTYRYRFSIYGGKPPYTVKVSMQNYHNSWGDWHESTSTFDKYDLENGGVRYMTGPFYDHSGIDKMAILVQDQAGTTVRYYFNCIEDEVPYEFKNW